MSVRASPPGGAALPPDFRPESGNWTQSGKGRTARLDARQKTIESKKSANCQPDFPCLDLALILIQSYAIKRATFTRTTLNLNFYSLQNLF